MKRRSTPSSLLAYIGIGSTCYTRRRRENKIKEVARKNVWGLRFLSSINFFVLPHRDLGQSSMYLWLLSAKASHNYFLAPSQILSPRSRNVEAAVCTAVQPPVCTF
jgi:hypothetical protein